MANWKNMNGDEYGDLNLSYYPNLSEEKKNLPEVIWGREYYFTEYYDSTSGLITRFKKIIKNNKEYFSAVDELQDGEFSGLEVTDDSITLSEGMGMFFHFPLHKVFNFLIRLGQRFPGVEGHPIFKWPEHIESEFKKLGINQDRTFGTHQQYEWDEKNIIDFDKHDKDFFVEIGKPIVGGLDGGCGFQMFKGLNGTSYGVKLKIFLPSEHGENERIEESYPGVF
jgi:hypothetical protein